MWWSDPFFQKHEREQMGRFILFLSDEIANGMIPFYVNYIQS